VCDGVPAKASVSITLMRLKFDQLTGKFVNDYEPPWLSVAGDSALIKICREIASLLRTRSGGLVREIKGAAQVLSGAAESRDRLRSLVTALPVLEALLCAGVAKKQYGHPFALYQALCAVAGSVALLGQDLIPPDFAPYNHSELLICFRHVADFIQLAVKQGISEQWRPVRFDSVRGGFELKLSEGLMAEFEPNPAQWPWQVIGLRMAPGQTLEQTHKWGERCLIASGDTKALRETRQIGAGRDEWTKPEDLNPPFGVLLFAIHQDSALNLKETLQVMGDPPLPAEAILFLRRKMERQEN
jgi:type VI secretion system protein ImpJ